MSFNPNNPNGQATMANSEPVVIASNQSSIPVASSIADGADIALGAKADASASTDTGTFSLLALIKRGLVNMLKAPDSDNAVLTNTKVLPVGGRAIDVTAPTPLAVGDATMGVHDNATGAHVVLQGDLDSRYDKVTISDKCIESLWQVTRPANATPYSANDVVSDGAAHNFAGVAIVGSGYDSSGYITGLRFVTTDLNTVGKRFTLHIYDNASVGNIVVADNVAASLATSFESFKVATIDIDTVTLSAVSAVAFCNLPDLRIAFKAQGTSFSTLLTTKDAYTPTTSANYRINLLITGNQ